MGLMSRIMDLGFGDGRNIVAETAGIFRENAENAAERELRGKGVALGQFSAEFQRPRQGLFDRVIDGLNRLPRPILAFGTIALFVVAMVNPVWFASRMQGIQLVPEPLWWLMGAIVSFYFGARHQAKGQDFQRSVAETMARTADVTRSVRALEALGRSDDAAPIDAPFEAPAAARGAHSIDDNPALVDWRRNGR